MSLKVLLAVEGSDISEYAFEYYFKYIHKEGNTVVLVHCPNPPKIPTFSRTNLGQYPSDKIMEIMKEYNEKIQKIESQYTTTLQQKRVPFLFKLLDGDDSVAHRIIKIATDEKVDLIAMGSKSGGGLLKRSMLRNVSDHVTHHSHFPVLVIQKPT